MAGSLGYILASISALPASQKPSSYVTYQFVTIPSSKSRGGHKQSEYSTALQPLHESSKYFMKCATGGDLIRTDNSISNNHTLFSKSPDTVLSNQRVSSFHTPTTR